MENESLTHSALLFLSELTLSMLCGTPFFCRELLCTIPLHAILELLGCLRGG
jgi:hypothetical protein